MLNVLRKNGGIKNLIMTSRTRRRRDVKSEEVGVALLIQIIDFPVVQSLKTTNAKKFQVQGKQSIYLKIRFQGHQTRPKLPVWRSRIQGRNLWVDSVAGNYRYQSIVNYVFSVRRYRLSKTVRVGENGVEEEEKDDGLGKGTRLWRHHDVNCWRLLASISFICCFYKYYLIYPMCLISFIVYGFESKWNVENYYRFRWLEFPKTLPELSHFYPHYYYLSHNWTCVFGKSARRVTTPLVYLCIRARLMF